LHGLSLDAQKMKLTEYAEEHNMRIVEWYVDEGVSARKLIRKRPELQRMIQDAEKGKFERIIFIKLDRFFRSVAEYHECMKRISPVVWTTTEEKYDLSTAQGRMLVNMKLTIAELEAMDREARLALLRPTESLFFHLPSLTLPSFYDRLISSGCAVALTKLRAVHPLGTRLRLYHPDGRFFALGEVVSSDEGLALKSIKTFVL
jgi:hypothetical protein